MNKKARLLLILISGLFLAALALSEAGLLILAVPLLIYLLVGLLQAPLDMTLTAERVVEAAAITTGEQVEISVTVRNQGVGLYHLHLQDNSFPLIGDCKNFNERMLALGTGETASLEYACRPARGIYVWASIRAEAWDPFGLFGVSREVEAPGELVVLPKPFRIKPITFRKQSTMLSSGPIPAGFAGSGTDYWGVREYLPGDALRRVNWHLAARHPGKLFTNEFEREEIADFGLVLDKRQLTGDASLESDLFEYSVSAASSLSEVYLKEGHRVSLLLFGQPFSAVFPGSGKHKLTELKVKLASASQSAYIPFDYLEYFPGRLFSSRSLVVVFSLLDSRDLRAYASLRAFGYDVLLISPDPVEYASRSLPEDEINQIALRAARIERIVHLKRLAQMGVKVIDWQVDRSLGAVAREAVQTFQRQSPQIGGRI